MEKGPQDDPRKVVNPGGDRGDPVDRGDGKVVLQDESPGALEGNRHNDVM